MTNIVIDVIVPETTDIEAVASSADVRADSSGAVVVLVAAPGPPGPAGTGEGGTPLVLSVAGRQGNVLLTKADVGLSNVNDTTDAAKPVSTAQQTALDAKVTYVAVTTGSEARPAGAVFVQWVDTPSRSGTTAPTNMTASDIWLKRT